MPSIVQDHYFGFVSLHSAIVLQSVLSVFPYGPHTIAILMFFESGLLIKPLDSLFFFCFFINDLIFDNLGIFRFCSFSFLFSILLYSHIILYISFLNDVILFFICLVKVYTLRLYVNASIVIVVQKLTLVLQKINFNLKYLVGA